MVTSINSIKYQLMKSVLMRRVFFVFFDVLLISLAICISFGLRFDWNISTEYKNSLYFFILLSLCCKMFFLLIYKLFDISWRFAGLNELIKVFKALTLGSLTYGMALFILRLSPPFNTTPFPRSILFIDYILSLILIGSFRISKRVVLEGIKKAFKPIYQQKILIIGAGRAGEQIVREMKRDKSSYYLPVGLIDDDPIKKGTIIHGVRVLGNRMDIPLILKKYIIDDVLIALPSSKSLDIREIAQIIRESGKEEKIKILPSVNDLINGNVTLSDIHEIKLADLLGRAAVNIDYETIKGFIQNKRILITGAGGSIGTELAKSILRFDPDTLIILDVDETELFYLINELKPCSDKLIPVIGDIKDKIKIESVLKKHNPHIILHAAAYKHVPILEFYPEEALKTNILGTKVLAEAAIKYGIEKFIFISTDKAVNPTSIMGATKRAGEEILKVYNKKNMTRFISVRFGNVLGSRGSVIPQFQKQINNGGPVTVTHPDMKRYFMITSEAVLLVLQAGAAGEGGEVFVLDMGEQVKIVDLAKEMIALITDGNGKDIPIVFTNVRPGEKLYEEIIGPEEGVEPTAYEKLSKARSSSIINPELLKERIDRLLYLSLTDNGKDEIIVLLKKIVPTFKPKREKFSIIQW